MSRKAGRNRLVVRISAENYLAMQTALTPPGADKPPFGVQSDFIDRLLDNWRTALARSLNEQRQTPQQPVES
jgi:hypothetical protein